MRERLPLALSCAALVVAVLGATPLGEAAGRAIAKGVPYAAKAGFAKNAGKLSGHTASAKPRAGQIPILNANGRLAASIGAVGPKGDPGPKGESGAVGISRYEQLQPKQVKITDKGQRDQTVTCPGGKSVLAGGYNIPQQNTQSPDVVVTESRPASKSAWKFRVDLLTGAQPTVYLFAICAEVE
jgi:hypothetical protein